MSSVGLASVDSSRRLILEAIGAGTQLDLVNCGGLVSDELAAAGARELLCQTLYRELRLDQLASATGETALLLGGGFSRDDHDVMPRALAVAELRFERVIVLPASFDPSEETVHRALSRTQATVFAREPESHRLIADMCDARLAHDCAFFFDFAPYARIGEGDLSEDISVTATDLEGWLERIAAHETVRTDRARVMIAAARMGKPVQYAADSELGTAAIAEYALADRPITAEQVDDETLAAATLSSEAEATVKRLSSAALATPAPGAATSTPRVTAVVLTRDRPELLLRTLASLERSQSPVRTLVVDNNSVPRAARALAVACERRKDTELKRSERNLGCAGGRRLGVELVDTEFVLFLDDDAELMPGAVEHLVSELDGHPDAGAVTATVVRSDGTVLHSGGSMDVDDEIVSFELSGDGVRFSDADLPPSGPSGWAPGGAMLARKQLLAEFPFDETMGAYFEDNEWCYRVSRVRADSFRRSREALVVHHTEPKHAPASDFASRSQMVELLASYARFYELHDRLLGPWLFDHIPGLRADDGSVDLAAARLLMELAIAKGTDWVFMEWMRGDLDGLLRANRRLVELQVVEAALEREKAETAHHERVIERERAVHGSTIAALEARMRRVDESVTWQLFLRVRARMFSLLGGGGSRGVRLLQSALRALGRALPRDQTRLAEGPEPPRLVAWGRGNGPIRFAEPSEPEVSIVMPLHAHAELTEAGLWSIVDNTGGIPYEVILVDDSEDPPTKALLTRVEGAQVIVNESNLGYRRSIERGAAAAKGRWLVLCNNDIEVQPGWLAALLDCGESSPDIAVAAPKFLYPGGTLAEAGGIVWRDGSGANYGRGDDPSGCHYEYRREIDYGSAAALMVRADFWRELGGFDERFEPMYYEDTDLCFEARSRGMRVMYEPRARVVHVEGATAGVDESVGHKRHQLENRPKFVEKWRELLEAEHLDNDQGKLWVAANRRRGPRVLVIDHRVPTWDRDSGGLRMRGMLEALIALGCNVSLLPDNGFAMQPYTRELQRMGVEVLYGVDSLTEVAQTGPWLSLVILSRVQIAGRWLTHVREHAWQAPVVFDTVDLHWLREARRNALGSNGAGLSAKVTAIRELELAMIRACDATLVVTNEERSQVLADVPEAVVHVVPNINPVRAPASDACGRKGVVFVGGFEHPPNVEGAKLLVRDVMPIVWRQLPDVPVTIVGADPPREVSALSSPLVDVAGWLPDLDPVLESARALVAPLSYGAGLKGKVTQALSVGLPVVTTPVGAEGLDAVDGEHLLIGERPDELAERVVRVLRDDALWERLSRAGRQLAADRCSPELVEDRLRTVLDELASESETAQLR